MEIIIILVGWIVFSHIFAAVVPALFELMPELIRFVFECLWIVLKTLFRSAAWLVVNTIMLAVWLVRGLRNGTALMFYLIDEWRRGPPEEEWDFAADESPESGAQDEEDAYDDALDRLGLPPDFTRDALKAAYRTAMRAAHPDAGGSARAAQEVNRAYEIVLHWNGWAR